MFLIHFYVPQSHLEIVKNAIFNTGAGNIANYSECSWQVLGEGQFMPLTGSNPAIGNANKREKISEYKVEIMCKDEHIEKAIDALKEAHPYEVPAYYVVQMVDKLNL